jgi:hypothetical protein
VFVLCLGERFRHFWEDSYRSCGVFAQLPGSSNFEVVPWYGPNTCFTVVPYFHSKRREQQPRRSRQLQKSRYFEKVNLKSLHWFLKLQSDVHVHFFLCWITIMLWWIIGASWRFDKKLKKCWRGWHCNEGRLRLRRRPTSILLADRGGWSRRRTALHLRPASHRQWLLLRAIMKFWSAGRERKTSHQVTHPELR